MGGAEPMECLGDPAAPPAAGTVTLVLLPAAHTEPEAFLEHGFAAALRERRWPVHPVPVRAHPGYYLDGTLTRRLEEEVIRPLRAQGHSRFWLAGISLGGFGALNFLKARGPLVEGVVLLAPFLATTGVIAEVIRAGGLDRWNALPAGPADHEHRLLVWLKTLPRSSTVLARSYLGYGREDRFAPASVLIAERLPEANIVSIEGGHDWPTWEALWERLLELDPFGFSR